MLLEHVCTSLCKPFFASNRQCTRALETPGCQRYSSPKSLMIEQETTCPMMVLFSRGTCTPPPSEHMLATYQLRHPSPRPLHQGFPASSTGSASCSFFTVCLIRSTAMQPSGQYCTVAASIGSMDEDVGRDAGCTFSLRHRWNASSSAPAGDRHVTLRPEHACLLPTRCLCPALPACRQSAPCYLRL